jgi:hypothetical protein
MWLFTKYGFYSVVCARQGDGRHGQPVDRERLMVRARSEAHLKALKDRFPEELGDVNVLETPSTDYRYRMFVKKAVWSRVLVGLNEEMDYDNFKSEAHRTGKHDGGSYEHALHQVWSVMNRLQSR